MSDDERDGWPADLVEMRREILAELEQRETELTEQRSRYPAGQSGLN